MSIRLRLVCILALVLAVGLTSGCPKKTIEATPESTPVAAPGPGTDSMGDDGILSEAQLSAIQREITASKVYFEYDQFTLREDGKTVLQSVADKIKRSNSRILVEGYCDERGTQEYNLALGERRARAVRDYLTMLGVNPNAIEVVSFGEEHPTDPGHNERAWSLNRRAEFKILR